MTNLIYFNHNFEQLVEAMFYSYYSLRLMLLAGLFLPKQSLTRFSY